MKLIHQTIMRDLLKAMLKWGTDYIIAAHTSADEFVGQVQCFKR